MPDRPVGFSPEDAARIATVVREAEQRFRNDLPTAAGASVHGAAFNFVRITSTSKTDDLYPGNWLQRSGPAQFIIKAACWIDEANAQDLETDIAYPALMTGVHDDGAPIYTTVKIDCCIVSGSGDAGGPAVIGPVLLWDRNSYYTDDAHLASAKEAYESLGITAHLASEWSGNLADYTVIIRLWPRDDPTWWTQVTSATWSGRVHLCAEYGGADGSAYVNNLTSIHGMTVASDQSAGVGCAAETATPSSDDLAADMIGLEHAKTASVSGGTTVFTCTNFSLPPTSREMMQHACVDGIDWVIAGDTNHLADLCPEAALNNVQFLYNLAAVDVNCSGGGGGGGGGGITSTYLGQRCASASSADQSVSLSGVTVPAGQMLLVLYAYRYTGSGLARSATATFAGSALSHSRSDSNEAGGVGVHGGQFYKAVGSDTTGNVVVNITSSNPEVLHLCVLAFRVAGLTHNTKDVANSTGGTGANPQTQPITTTVADEYICAMFVTVTPSAGEADGTLAGGFTDGQHVEVDGVLRICENYQMTSDTGTYESSKTGTPTYTAWVGIISGYK